MDLAYASLVAAVLLFAGMIGAGEFGRSLARRRAKLDPDGAWRGGGVVDGAIFGLLGLIVAFTFSGAASRFDARRNLIIDEANSIGTAYLRLDLLPIQSQQSLRENLRRYLESRIRVYEKFPDKAAINSELEAGAKLQASIWTEAVRSTKDSQSAAMLLLPAFNQMFDIASSRTLATMIHPPLLIFALLFGLALISSMFAGYGMANAHSHGWLHTIGFAAVTAITFYVIIDIEHPRLGVIRVEGLDEALRSLRSSMN